MKPPILIVDDDPHIRRTVRLILQRSGYEVLEAKDGAECLHQLRSGFRGVLLLDVRMPNVDGWSAVRHMVEEDLIQQNLVCMLTVIRAPGEAATGLEDAVFDYLPKPFDAAQLVGMVENASMYLAA